MAATAFQALYDQELIAGFERRESILRKWCTTRGIVKGNSFIFDIVDSGSASAQTRGANGQLQSRSNNDTQVTLQMAEWHDLVEKTGFNIFSSQGDQRAAMQMTSMAVINRKIDDLIIAALATATLNAAAAATTLSVDYIMHALVILGNGNVPLGSDVYGLITPAGWGYLMQVKEITSKDYVDTSMMVNAPIMFKWAGVTWQVHTGLPGNATAAETCFVFHKSAIGSGMNTAGIQSPVGYDDKQDASWARMSAYMGAKLLQNPGIVKLPHDGSALSTTF